MQDELDILADDVSTVCATFDKAAGWQGLPSLERLRRRLDLEWRISHLGMTSLSCTHKSCRGMQCCAGLAVNEFPIAIKPIIC